MEQTETLLCDRLIFGKDAKLLHWGSCFLEIGLEQFRSLIGKMMNDNYLTLYAKINLKLILDINIKGRTLKLI